MIEGATPGLYQAVALALFAVGAAGVLVRRNVIVVFMCIELMLNGANLSLVAFSRQLGDESGAVLAFLVMVVAAVEVAVGLGIVLSVLRHRDSLNVEDISRMRW